MPAACPRTIYRPVTIFNLSAGTYSLSSITTCIVFQPSILLSEVNSRPSPSSPMANSHNFFSQITIHLGMDMYRRRRETVVDLANQGIVRRTDSSGSWNGSIESVDNTGTTASWVVSF